MDLSPSTSAPSTSKWSVVRPKGPAVLPARVEGPGGCHPHPVRPNGPTVPRTARASRGMVGPLGRHMSRSVRPGPLGRAGGTVGPLGRKTPAAAPPAPQPTPEGFQRDAGGSSAATTPGPRPPKTPAPRRWCQKSRVNRTTADDSHRTTHRPSCAAVSVRRPNNSRSGGRCRVAPGDLSWRPFARRTRPKLRQESVMVEGICTCPLFVPHTNPRLLSRAILWANVPRRPHPPCADR